MSTRKKVISSSASTDALLTGEKQIATPETAMQPTAKLRASQFKTTPTNPRYRALVAARVLQPNHVTKSGSARKASSTHINKLTRTSAILWAQKVKKTWLLSDSGKAWLANEVRAGHKLNFEDPADKDLDAIWRAYTRRWYERVERMLMRCTPDAAEIKRLEAQGEATSEQVQEYRGKLKRIEALLSQWSHLLALASSIHKDGLIQPIRVRPCGGGYFEIVAGERRYWACRLTGMDNIPYAGAVASDLVALSQMLHENLDRLDVDREGWVLALRRYMSELTGQPCGPDNPELNLAAFQNEFGGRSKSWCHRWRGVCQLPDDSLLLARICSGEISGIRNIDEHVRAYHRARKGNKNPEQYELPDTPGAAGGDEEQKTQAQPPAGAPSPKSPPSSPPAPAAKARLPGTEGGIRIFQALKTIEGVSDQARSAIETAIAGWRGAPEKYRRKCMEEVFDALAAALDPLDEAD
ncbi:ParB N-terminal domain-containing protein [Pseudomonas sp. EMN2]|uniref:ParB N-terminal domain-containing protein n=1 Tax=Pseudomonas sp. EMN2 TaxID=2615212 RepID=UPI00129B218F|nr:ParB N-terminal domain-containing protein [Pseudomonas sp. EMN2]